MRYLKTNTATTITVGPFFDVTDGITPETALTVTGCHLTMVVDNAGTPTLAIDADATASGGNNDMVHITNDDAGYYSLELTAAQTNYLGGASLTIVDTDVHLPVFHEFTILPALVYDSLISGSDNLQVDVREVQSTQANQLADALLNRDMGSVTVTNTRSPINALRAIRNKWSISGSTITFTTEDDTTEAWTATIVGTAGANPITSLDPAGP